MSIQIFSNADDVKREIIEAIESGGNLSSDDFDIDQVYAECYGWHHEYTANGEILPGRSGVICTATDDEFWESVFRNEK
ncbi:hypothetical protein [Corynebacterium pygosceleis]|uniref:hypothetical protein n=1 Tax=Corynebacterium pygosceleis TaxID=2800406 RepID=UPI002003FF09|nr:hypothetical protein [Corynebacterium pygosceleis]MCK7675240.1 hypothetical protein [Corynebacterium pygosceleis]